MRTRIGRRVAAPVAAGLALTLVLAACGGKDEPADQSDDSATGELVIANWDASTAGGLF